MQELQSSIDKIAHTWVRTTLQRTTEQTVVVVEFQKEVPLDIVLRDMRHSMCNLQSKCFLLMTELRYSYTWQATGLLRQTKKPHSIKPTNTLTHT